MNKLKTAFAISALMLTGLGLTACDDADEPEAPAEVVTTATIEPSVSVSPSTSASPSASVSVSASPSKVEIDPADCAPNDENCPDVPGDGN